MRDNDVTGQKVGPDHVWGHVSISCGVQGGRQLSRLPIDALSEIKFRSNATNGFKSRRSPTEFKMH